MKLKDYIYDIFLIGTENDVDIGVARDMFVCNLNLRENKYKGADVDYKKLGEQWVALGPEEQYEQLVEYTRITLEYQDQLHEPWMARNRVKFEEVLANLT